VSRKVLIVVFLLAHLVVHPLVHLSGFTDSPVNSTFSTGQSPIRGSEDCGLCRISNTLVLLAVVALISASVVTTKSRDWTQPSLQSTELLLHIPSRAPPAFA
jgi:hypothetical protein